MNPINSITALLSMAKGLDISMMSFICVGWLFLDKGENLYALICFGFALISAIVVIYCKAKYHLKDEQISPSKTEEVE